MGHCQAQSLPIRAQLCVGSGHAQVSEVGINWTMMVFIDRQRQHAPDRNRVVVRSAPPSPPQPMPQLRQCTDSASAPGQRTAAGRVGKVNLSFQNGKTI